MAPEEKNSGWISLARGFQQHWLYPKGRKFTLTEAWLDLLLLCNFIDNKALVDKELIVIKRGQLFTSVSKLGDRWMWSRHEIRSFLNLLQRDEMIAVETTNKFTMITVCNYDIYQNKQPTKNQRSTNKQPSADQRTDTTNNLNKENNNININIPLHFVSVEFLGVFQDWLEYKRQRRETYKSEKSLEACYKKLLRLSGNDPQVARKIIDEAMSNNYAGFFPLQDKSEIPKSKPGNTPPFRNDRV